MKARGYAGQILHVNLSSGEVRKEPLDPALAKGFVGGFGINTKLAYDLIVPGVSPLSPDNVIILGAGALGGTMAPGSSRLAATTKFPETGTVASASGSLSFASQLKYAGYDHLVISGRAAKPSYLHLLDERVEVCDASHLWGKDLYETTDELWRKHGRASGIVAIGQAGENLVGISLALVNKCATLGKGGLGAVMGAKKLKAIVVRGTRGIGVADTRRFMKLIDGYIERVRTYPRHKQWVELGINLTWPDWMKAGFHYKHGTELYPASMADQLYGIQTYLEKVKRDRVSCPSCPIADKEVYEIREGQDKGLVTYASGFIGRAVNFGIRCQVGGYDSVIKCLDTANRYGIDAHSAGNLIDYALCLYERGVITAADTAGLVLRRDRDTTLKLLKQIAFREGLGDVLADGEARVIRQFGLDAEKEALHVKGLELSFDPRLSGLGTMEFETVVNPRGGHHSSGGSPTYAPHVPLDRFARHCGRMGASHEAIARILDSPSGFNVGRLTRYAEDWHAVLSSLGLCNRGQINRFHTIGSCAELYSAATGIELTPAELATAGERAWNVMKASNVREGFTRGDDRFPAKWFEPIKSQGEERRLRDYYGTRSLTPEDTERLLDDYYDERGWDRKEGIPTEEKLRKLGLDWICEDLKRIARQGR